MAKVESMKKMGAFMLDNFTKTTKIKQDNISMRNNKKNFCKSMIKGFRLVVER